MVRVFPNDKLNSFCVYCVLIVFSFYLIPQAHAAQNPWSYKEVLFCSKVTKIVDKIKKYGKALDQGKTIGAMYELKKEVESYTGQKLKVDKCFDAVIKQLIQRGAKISKEDSVKLKKIIKNQSACHKNKGDEDDDPKMPLTVVVGVTMALCGFFLFVLPLPPCKIAGKYLMEGGVTLAVEGTIWKLQEDQEKEDD